MGLPYISLKAYLLCGRPASNLAAAASGGNTNLVLTCFKRQYNTIQFNTIPYNTIQYNIIQYNTIQYNESFLSLSIKLFTVV